MESSLFAEEAGVEGDAPLDAVVFGDVETVKGGGFGRAGLYFVDAAGFALEDAADNYHAVVDLQGKGAEGRHLIVGGELADGFLKHAEGGVGHRGVCVARAPRDGVAPRQIAYEAEYVADFVFTRFEEDNVGDDGLCDTDELAPHPFHDFLAGVEHGWARDGVVEEVEPCDYVGKFNPGPEFHDVPLCLTGYEGIGNEGVDFGFFRVGDAGGWREAEYFDAGRLRAEDGVDVAAGYAAPESREGPIGRDGVAGRVGDRERVFEKEGGDEGRGVSLELSRGEARLGEVEYVFAARIEVTDGYFAALGRHGGEVVASEGRHRGERHCAVGHAETEDVESCVRGEGDGAQEVAEFCETVNVRSGRPERFAVGFEACTEYGEAFFCNVLRDGFRAGQRRNPCRRYACTFDYAAEGVEVGEGSMEAMACKP